MEKGSSSGVFVSGRRKCTSTGIDAMDSLLGSGMALSTIIAIDEIGVQGHSAQIVRCFFAGGVVHGHSLFIASLDRDTNQILMDIPEESKVNEAANSSVPSMDEPMKIAWRYESTPFVQSDLSQGKLGKRREWSSRRRIPLQSLPPVQCWPSSEHDHRSYENLYRWLVASFESNNGAEKKLMRVVIDGIGSPLYSDDENLLPFMVRLRSLTLRSHVIVLLTFNSMMMREETVARLQRYCDAVFRLEAIVDTNKEGQNLYASCDGLFRIIKLPTLAGLRVTNPECVDLIYRIDHGQFEIQVLHLPPAEQSNNDLACASIANF